MDGITGGLPFLILCRGGTLSLHEAVGAPSGLLLFSASDRDFFDLPNIPFKGFRKLLAKLPASLAVGVDEPVASGVALERSLIMLIF